MSSNCGLAAHCVATGSPCSSFSQDTQKIIDKIQNGEDIHIGRMVKTWPLSSWPGRVFLDNTTSQKWCGLVMLAASSYISLSFRPSTNMMWNIGKQFLYIHSRLQFFWVAELLRCLVLIARTSKRTNGGASTPQTLSPGMIWHVMWLWCGWCDDFPKVPAPRSTVCVEYLNRCKTSIFYIVSKCRGPGTHDCLSWLRRQGSVRWSYVLGSLCSRLCSRSRLLELHLKGYSYMAVFLTSIILFNCTLWDRVPDGSVQWSSSVLVSVCMYHITILQVYVVYS